MRVWIFVLLAALVGAATARAHDDVVPYEVAGKIITGGHDDVEGTNQFVERVFGYDFGELDPVNQPYFALDPGFNNGTFTIAAGFPNQGLLPTGKTLGFNVLSNLTYWDADLNNPISFGPAPADVELGLALGVTEVRISGTGQTGTVPSISGTGAAGRVHVHLGSTLFHNGEAIPDEDPLENAPDGVYIVSLDLKLSGLVNSDPIFIVYNNGVGEDAHDAAIEWAATHLVPEPSTWLMMGTALVGLAAVGWKRRRDARLAG